MPDTEATRTPGVTVRHVRAASRAELERRVLTLQPAHDALLAASAMALTELDDEHNWDGYPDNWPKRLVADALRAAIAAASEAGSGT